MTAHVRPLRPDEMALVVPLIGDYQRFYGAPDPDPERNAEFFARFIEPSDIGLLLGAFAGERDLAGYACLYWTFSSVSATEVVLLNDLYVCSGRRGGGVGMALIDATVAVARQRGAARVRWWTAHDNDRAQRLYDRTGAACSSWLEYEIAL